jgi:hypothetical protein
MQQTNQQTKTKHMALGDLTAIQTKTLTSALETCRSIHSDLDDQLSNASESADTSEIEERIGYLDDAIGAIEAVL